MNRFFKCLYSEYLKFWYLRATKIVIALVVLLQSGLAYLAGKQTLAVGLDASPETNPNLLEAIPPVEYIGFEVLFFGLLPMIVLGAVYGSHEYQKQGMRTALLCVNRKSLFFTVKLFLAVTVSFVIAFAAIFSTVSVTHLSLGDAGVRPFVLTPLVWRFMALAALSWTGLTVLAFVMAFLFRTAIIPLLFLIPQVYNLGQFLAERFPPARLLPVYAGQGLIATNVEIMNRSPLGPLLILTVWILIFGGLACVRLIKSDLKGAH